MRARVWLQSPGHVTIKRAAVHGSWLGDIVSARAAGQCGPRLNCACSDGYVTGGTDSHNTPVEHYHDPVDRPCRLAPTYIDMISGALTTAVGWYNGRYVRHPALECDGVPIYQQIGETGAVLYRSSYGGGNWLVGSSKRAAECSRIGDVISSEVDRSNACGSYHLCDGSCIDSPDGCAGKWRENSAAAPGLKVTAGG